MVAKPLCPLYKNIIKPLDRARYPELRYTLHLDTYSNSYRQSFYSFSYVVDLYKVTPEYYRFLKSINDAQSNSWADVGLMQVTPTYSNVKGGFGVVAGYNISSVSKFF